MNWEAIEDILLVSFLGNGGTLLPSLELSSVSLSHGELIDRVAQRALAIPDLRPTWDAQHDESMASLRTTPENRD